MGVDFYALRRRGVKVFDLDGRLETVYFLQLVIGNALSPDARGIIDSAIRSTFAEWESRGDLPAWVVQVASDGKLQPGLPIFRWGTHRRLYCFDDELLQPHGYLGKRESGGFRFRTVKEQEHLNDLATARRIDEGGAKVFKDFWAGETFRTGSDFLAYRRGGSASPGGIRRGSDPSHRALSPKLYKIVHLIRFIESKGKNASSADLQFLTCLKSKAVQLGYALH